ncbi:hypothetical protein KY366_06090 [Candidatus Woesearchaeota archaeon]|nr:hypothetical protein [Candidatus Woesearchaeota archaeon]
MKKRGQIYGSFFKYILIGVITVMIVLFGINALNRVNSASCRSGMVLLEDGLKKSVESVYSDIGSVSEKSFKIPCNIDKVYFVDLKKDNDRLFRSLSDYPLIRDAIEDSTRQNAFLVKDDKVVSSFYAGNIELEKPYFLCSETSRKDLGLYLGGTGSSAALVNKECQYDCTFEVVNITKDIAEKILEECKASPDYEGCPNGTIEEELDRFVETNQTVRIARRCNCGRDPGTTVVEILIQPEGSVEHFKLIERIPKDYVGDLYEHIKEISGDDYDYFKVISPDPLIMWHFSELSEDTIVSYVLDSDIAGYCADIIQSVGVGVTLESEHPDLGEADLAALSEEVLDEVPDDVPPGDRLTTSAASEGEVPTPTTETISEFELTLDSVDIGPSKSNTNIFKVPLWHLPAGNSALDKGRRFKGYTYEISAESYSEKSAVYTPSSGTGTIACNIGKNKIVSCEVSSDFSDPANSNSHTFKIRVTNPHDPSDSKVDTFTVKAVTAGDYVFNLLFTNPIDIEARSSNGNVLANPLWKSFTDSDGNAIAQDVFQGKYTCGISTEADAEEYGQSATRYDEDDAAKSLICAIDYDTGLVSCDVNGDFTAGEYDFYIKITSLDENGKTYTDSFTVRVTPYIKPLEFILPFDNLEIKEDANPNADVFEGPVYNYLRDSSGAFVSNPGDYAYKISSDGATYKSIGEMCKDEDEIIECSIDSITKKVYCKANSFESSYSQEFYLQITKDSEAYTDSFTVNIPEPVDEGFTFNLPDLVTIEDGNVNYDVFGKPFYKYLLDSNGIPIDIDSLRYYYRYEFSVQTSYPTSTSGGHITVKKSLDYYPFPDYIACWIEWTTKNVNCNSEIDDLSMFNSFNFKIKITNENTGKSYEDNFLIRVVEPDSDQNPWHES